VACVRKVIEGVYPTFQWNAKTTSTSAEKLCVIMSYLSFLQNLAVYVLANACLDLPNAVRKRYCYK
jgi:hypothetical protein